MQNPDMGQRFRGFLPVIIDVETGGFNPETDALLEIAAVTLNMDSAGRLSPKEVHHYHVAPFENSKMEPAALAFIGMDPYHPFRLAISEKEALTNLFTAIRREMKTMQCHRAVLVGHNAAFDLSFVNSAVKRIHYKRCPFHPFTTFDTATLSGLAFGQTVLAKAVKASGGAFNVAEAHSALYDAQRTAELFCFIVNMWEEHIGFKSMGE
jgi:ribonuclease T